MERIIVNKKMDIYEINLSWKLEGTGVCALEIDDSFLLYGIQEMAKMAKMDIQLRYYGKRLEQKEFMGVMGSIFAEAICTQCESLGEYRGLGRADVTREMEQVWCELRLPGRVDWVYEAVAKNIMKDTLFVSNFFGKLAESAELCLKFHMPDYGEKNALSMFGAFGKALGLAYLPKEG